MEPTDPTPPLKETEAGEVERQRYQILEQIEEWLDTPVMILGILWLVLLVIDLTQGLSPFLNSLVLFIWAIFVVDFALRFVLAPRKLSFLRSNWLTALSLFIPALRIGRIARVARVLRAARGARLVSVVSSVNRGMRVLRAALARQAFGYVLLLTLVVTLVGAAGIYAFEAPVSDGSISTYGEALWWTSMIMTNYGTEYWPRSAEGRLLTLLLATYALGVFGYITATLATFIIGTRAAADEETRSEIQALRHEIAALRKDLGNGIGRLEE